MRTRSLARTLSTGLVKDLKNSDAIFHIYLIGTKKITVVKTKDTYTVLLHRTKKDASFKTKWENIFIETINRKEVWQTLNSGLIENYDFDVI